MCNFTEIFVISTNIKIFWQIISGIFVPTSNHELQDIIEPKDKSLTLNDQSEEWEKLDAMYWILKCNHGRY